MGGGQRLIEGDAVTEEQIKKHKETLACSIIRISGELLHIFVHVYMTVDVPFGEECDRRIYNRTSKFVKLCV